MYYVVCVAFSVLLNLYTCIYIYTKVNSTREVTLCFMSFQVCMCVYVHNDVYMIYMMHMNVKVHIHSNVNEYMQHTHICLYTFTVEEIMILPFQINLTDKM